MVVCVVARLGYCECDSQLTAEDYVLLLGLGLGVVALSEFCSWLYSVLCAVIMVGVRFRSAI